MYPWSAENWVITLLNAPGFLLVPIVFLILKGRLHLRTVEESYRHLSRLHIGLASSEV